MSVDFTVLKRMQAEINDLVNDLDGMEYEDDSALEGQTRSVARQRNAAKGQAINRLADLYLDASAAARREYWFARGHRDHYNPDRE